MNILPMKAPPCENYPPEIFPQGNCPLGKLPPMKYPPHLKIIQMKEKTKLQIRTKTRQSNYKIWQIWETTK